MADTVELPTPETPQEQTNQPWRLLATLPSVNWSTVSGTGVLWFTMVNYCAWVWTGRDVKMSATAWDSWLFFVATGVLSVSAAKFAAKRLTYKPGAPDAMRGAAATPGPEAEAERERAAAVETARTTAQHPVPPAPAQPAPAPPATPVVVNAAPVVVPQGDVGAVLDQLQAEARRRAMATSGLGGAASAGAGAPATDPTQPPGQGD